MSWADKIRRKTAASVQLTMDCDNIHLSMAGVPMTAAGSTLAEAMARLVTELRAAGERSDLHQTLAGMVRDSTDAELRAWLTSAPPAVRPSTVLARRRDEVLRIAERFGAINVRVIGSVARGEDVPGSDVDLLIGTRPGFSLLDLVGLANDLEDLLGVPVDVLTEGGLRPGRDDGIRDEARAL